MTWFILFMFTLSTLELMPLKSQDIMAKKGFLLKKADVPVKIRNKSSLITVIARYFKSKNLEISQLSDNNTLLFATPQNNLLSLGHFCGTARLTSRGTLSVVIKGNFIFYLISSFIFREFFFIAVIRAAAVIVSFIFSGSDDLAFRIAYHFGLSLISAIDIAASYCIVRFSGNRYRKTIEGIKNVVAEMESNPARFFINVECPACGKVFTDIPVEWRGKKVRCEACKKEFGIRATNI